VTSRERLLAACRGGSVDRRPRISWLAEDPEADAQVVTSVRGEQCGGDNRMLLVDVANPFGLALETGVDINQMLKDDPSSGGEVLDSLVAAVREQIVAGLDGGADGIFYRLHGANPRHCSPMQYGGHFLERDRELLCEASDASLNVLFVAGGEELYIDFVSDLPTHVFAWDSELSGLTAGAVRTSRRGALASSDPAGEIDLNIGIENYLESLEQTIFG